MNGTLSLYTTTTTTTHVNYLNLSQLCKYLIAAVIVFSCRRC